MPKMMRSPSLVLAAALTLASALGAATIPPTANTVAMAAPATVAQPPALAQILGAATPAEAPAFLASGAALGRLTFQCIPLPVDCCQVGWNGHCHYCIHRDPSCGLP
jgi:hypothetical protein